jgi:hypothetical protein
MNINFFRPRWFVYLGAYRRCLFVEYETSNTGLLSYDASPETHQILAADGRRMPSLTLRCCRTEWRIGLPVMDVVSMMFSNTGRSRRIPSLNNYLDVKRADTA